MSFGEKMDESFEATKRRDENFWADSPLASDESFGDVLNEVVPFKRTMINNIEESPSPIRPITNKKGFGIEETLEVDVKKVYQEVDEVNLENFFPSKSHRRHSSSSTIKKDSEEKEEEASKLKEPVIKKHERKSKKEKASKKEKTKEVKKHKKEATKKTKKKVARPPPTPEFIAQSPSENILKHGHQSAVKKRNLSDRFEYALDDPDDDSDHETISKQISPMKMHDEDSAPGSAKKKKTSGSFCCGDRIADAMFSSPLKPLRGRRSFKEFTRCLIVREKGGLMKKTAYYMHIQNQKDEPVQLVLAAQKNTKGKTPNYHIYDMTHRAYGKEFSKKNGNYIGKLRTNFGGSFCTLYDKTEVEHCSVVFSKEHQGISSRIKQDTDPRVMRVLLPRVDEDGIMRVSLQDQTMKEKLVTHLDIDKDGYIHPPQHRIGSSTPEDQYQILGNKQPSFVRGSYRLNFGGRVLLPSVKNFQLCDVDEVKSHVDVEVTSLDDILLQFGKVKDNEFHLDFKQTLTPFQAFGILLAQFNFSF
jgi:hypothetical protein